MKIYIVLNDGTLLDTIEDVEQYDLSKPMARAALVDEIRRGINIGKSQEGEE
jgi:hypothetical protein